MPRKSPGSRVDRLVEALQSVAAELEPPALERVAPDPFQILVACILSLRTKDAVTEATSTRLFAVAATPEAILDLPTDRVAELIYPCAFYNTKARQLQALCQQLQQQHRGQVPPRLADLLALPGVGLKTANLVLSLGFGQDAICVDTHVHRISNRLGFIATRTADDSEAALRRVVAKKHWRTLNRAMVVYGQQICQPVSPWCSRCTLQAHCPRVGVVHSR